MLRRLLLLLVQASLLLAPTSCGDDHGAAHYLRRHSAAAGDGVGVGGAYGAATATRATRADLARQRALVRRQERAQAAEPAAGLLPQPRAGLGRTRGGLPRYKPAPYGVLAPANTSVLAAVGAPPLPVASAANRERLAVAYFAHRGWGSKVQIRETDMGAPVILHARLLNCSITLLHRNIGEHTPFDVLVFAPPDAILRDGYPDWMKRWGNVYLYPQEDIRAPLGVTDPEIAENPYIIVCSWRIWPQMDIIRSLGYKYLLQHDDDAFVLRPFESNLLDLMRGKKVGGYCRECAHEFWTISRGGAELMRFFLAAKGLREPIGPLLNHTDPPGIAGLFSAVGFLSEPEPTDGTSKTTRKGGWNAAQIAGNWNLFDVDFWFTQPVQDFVTLALGSAMQWNARWVDLMVQSMVVELFVREHEFFVAAPGQAKHISHWEGVPEMCRTELGISEYDAKWNLIDGKGEAVDARGTLKHIAEAVAAADAAADAAEDAAIDAAEAARAAAAAAAVEAGDEA